MTYGHIHFSMKSWFLLYQLFHVKVLRTGFGLSCATSWSQLMWSLFKAVPVPGAIFHFPYMNQQKVVNHCYRLNGIPIFSHSKIFQPWLWYMQVDIMWCWKLNKHGVLLRLGWYLLCCALVTKVFVLQIFMIDIHQWGQSKGSSNSKYKGCFNKWPSWPISNRPIQSIYFMCW